MTVKKLRLAVAMFTLASVALGATPLLADELAAAFQIAPGIVTRADSLAVTIKLAQPLTGDGKLTLTWTDALGRTVAVEHRDVKVGGDTVAVRLPLARAVALRNFLAGELTVGNATEIIPPAEFIVTPDGPWDDYVVVMYYGYGTPQQQQALRDCGVTAGKINGGKTLASAGPWWKNDFRYYCDQIACDYYAAYHNPMLRPKWKLFLDAQAAHKADPASIDPLIRRPCLLDPDARADAMKKMRQAVQTHMPFKPFWYSTDECGVTDLAAAWDFCYDPRTLAAMRKWLVEKYGSLDGINKQWGTKFARLDDVAPQTTDQAMTRPDENYSSWADHRYFMNKCFADAVKDGTDAVHAADPTALAGLLGCQAPSAYGGYDYWLLSKSMDMIEPYNIGNNREVWRSFAPRKPAVTTGFGGRDMEVWRLWYQALHGDLGVIIYDERHRYLDDQAKPTKLAAGIEPTYRELTGGVIKQLRAMERTNDPIAIHYSQPSITAYWMLEHRELGKAWAEVHPEKDRRDSPFMRVRESWCRLLEDCGLGYKFVANAQLEAALDGEFDKSALADIKVMILPQSIAMSAKECEALRRFVKRGGLLIADCQTALMDENCRMLGKGQLDDLFGIERKDTKFAPGPAGLKVNPETGIGPTTRPEESFMLSAAEPGIKPSKNAILLDSKGTPAYIFKNYGKGLRHMFDSMAIYSNIPMTDYHRLRMRPPQGEELRGLLTGFLELGCQPRYPLALAGNPKTSAPAYAVEVHPFESGNLRIVGLHRNYQIRTWELGPPEYQKQEALEKPLEVTVDLGMHHAVYQLRAGAGAGPTRAGPSSAPDAPDVPVAKYLGVFAKVTVPIDRLQPTLLAILPEPVTGLEIVAPKEVATGQMLSAKLRLLGPAVGDVHALRVTLIGPDGKELPILTRNVLARKSPDAISPQSAEVQCDLPIAVNDVKGDYVLEVRDVATGTKARRKFAVK